MMQAQPTVQYLRSSASPGVSEAKGTSGVIAPQWSRAAARRLNDDRDIIAALPSPSGPWNDTTRSATWEGKEGR
jgi:hypothetical protein